MSIRILQRLAPWRPARVGIALGVTIRPSFKGAGTTSRAVRVYSTNAVNSSQASIDEVEIDEGVLPNDRQPTAPPPPINKFPAPSSPPIPPFESEIQGTGEFTGNDWSRSYHGLSSQPFSPEIGQILMQPIDPLDIEMKPDGLIYLPEIKYRRILNKAFGPGGWGLAPRGETNVGPKIVSREYALVCLGRLVAISRGQQEYFDPNGIAMATEACKSNALMRCCKDLGIASELWDPRFIREFKAKYCLEVFVEHVVTKRKRKLWRRKDSKFEYPYKEG